MKTLRLTAICLSALLLVAAGCSGGSSDKPLGPFLVDSISPADGSTDMAVISVIQIEFTNAVKNVSIQYGTNFIVAETAQPTVAIAGSYRIDASGRILTFTPNGPLAESADFQVVLTENIQDVSGQTLDLAMSLAPVPTSFQTGEEGTFDRLQTGILDISCASSSCHSFQSVKGGLVLHRQVSYDSIVNVVPDNPVAAARGDFRITPNDFDYSFLLRKLHGPLTPGEGGFMPEGLPVLDSEKIDVFTVWVAAGAPRRGTVPGDEDVPQDVWNPATPPAPPPPGQGYQIELSPFNLLPGGDMEVGEFLYLGNPTEEYVNRFEIVMNEGSHHFILYTYNGSNPGGFPPGHFDIFNEGPADRWLRSVLAAAQSPTAEVSLPSGVAVKLKPNQPLLLDSHYVNTFNVPIVGKVYVNLWTIPVASVQHEAIAFIDNNFNIFVLPFDTRTTSQTMTFNQPAELILLGTHMHKRGILFETFFHNGAAIDWQIGQTTDWQHPPLMRFDPPLSFQAGQGIYYETTHHNDHPTDGPRFPSLQFGLTSNDDMAIILGYYYFP